MLGRALTYLVLYSTLGMVLRWSFGVRLLTMADDEVAPSDSRVERQDSGLMGGEGASVGGGHGASSAEGTLFDEPEEGEEERQSVRSTGTRSSGSESPTLPTFTIFAEQRLTPTAFLRGFLLKSTSRAPARTKKTPGRTLSPPLRVPLVGRPTRPRPRRLNRPADRPTSTRSLTRPSRSRSR